MGPMLSSEVAIVTGAASGIGRASVLRFLEEGARVHGFDRDEAGGRALEQECRARSLPFVFHQVDLLDRAAIQEAVDTCLAREGQIDILFNNAGVSFITPIETTTDEIFDVTFGVNFRAVYTLCQIVLPLMKARRRGVILNTASELAWVAQPGYTAYCGSKGAVLAFTRALALESAPFGIRVNALCPGPIDTPMLQAEFRVSPDAAAEEKAVLSTIPLGRLGRAGDMAEVAVFLVSSRAAFVHGAAWLADGGKTIL